MPSSPARPDGAVGAPGPAIQIRPARPDEYSAIGQITVDAYRDLWRGDHYGSYEDQLLAVAERAADSVVLVAVDEEGELLGGVTYVPDSDRAMTEFDDPEAAGIRMLAVRPDHQSRGVGRALTQACIDRARADGRARIILHSTEVMVRARAMYERMGFVPTPDLDVFVARLPDGEKDLRLIAFVLEL
ncbi:MAG: GNAT family N-acetyltransferase [Acidimicrobiales bacterium]|jgi:predicted N-acetyltransferase YhbS